MARIQTPAFMPVGTQATVKAADAGGGARTGAEILLGNTYHLMLRPGAERVAALGGLHTIHELAAADPDRFRRLPGMSLSQLRKIDENAVTFRSHLDGAMVRTVARARDRDPGAARRRHRRCSSTNACGCRRRARRSSARCSFRCAGRSAASAPSRARSGPRAVRHRAGRRRSGVAHRKRARAGRDGFPGLRDRRARGRRAAGGDAGDDRGTCAGICRPTGRAI